MAIFTLWALGSAVVGIISGIVYGIISAIFASILVKVLFTEKKLPFNWQANMYLPIGAAIFVGAIAGYIVGMIDSANDNDFSTTSFTTILWSSIGLISTIFPIIEANKELKLEKIILSHPESETIFATITSEYKIAMDNLVDGEELIDRSDIMIMVMERYNLNPNAEEMSVNHQQPLLQQQLDVQQQPQVQQQPAVQQHINETIVQNNVENKPAIDTVATTIDDHGFEWLDSSDGRIWFRKQGSTDEWFEYQNQN